MIIIFHGYSKWTDLYTIGKAFSMHSSVCLVCNLAIIVLPNVIEVATDLHSQLLSCVLLQVKRDQVITLQEVLPPSHLGSLSLTSLSAELVAELVEAPSR